MATSNGMSMGSIFNQMKENPIYQQRWAQVSNQGQDKRAVSNINRIIGEDIANQHSRFMDIDDTSKNLSRRADKLEFSKKVEDFKADQFNKKLGIEEDAFEEEMRRSDRQLDWDIERRTGERDFSKWQNIKDVAIRDEAMKSNNQIANAKLDLADSEFGMEFALGLFSTGTEIYGDYKASRYQRKEEEQADKLNSLYDEQLKYWGNLNKGFE